MKSQTLQRVVIRMNFVSLINTLDNSNLTRECVMFKDADLMQKTINYTNGSTFSVRINSSTFNDINQLLILNKNNNLYLYLMRQINASYMEYDEFELENINSIGVT